MAEIGAGEKIYRFGDFELSPQDRMLRLDGVRVALTPRAFDLLVALVEADGHLVSKHALMDKVWADAVVEEGNLNRTISSLRKALGETRNGTRYIETVPKAGYRFVAEMGRAGSREPESALRTDTKPSDRKFVNGTAAADPLNSEVKFRWSRFASVTAFLILFGSLAAAYFIFREGRAAEVATAERPKVVRLTNVPFDEDGAYFSDDGKIRFGRLTSPGRGESMIMEGDGSQTRIETAPIKDFAGGVWSRDGRKVIYAKATEDRRAYFLANADGSGETKLPFTVGPLDWSLDGSQIVVNNRYPADTTNAEILLYTVSTGELKNLTNHPAFDADPSFSPDGKQIAFISGRDGPADVYVMNSDGSNVRRLTSDLTRDAFPVFSPDGTQIAFNSNRENEKVGIYLINVNDLSPPRKLSDTTHNAEIRPGCWASDGTRLVFTSDAAGDKHNVYLMNDVEAAKSKLVVSYTDADIQSASLALDNRRLALGLKLSNGRGEIRAHDLADGSERTLTTTTEAGLNPAWSPDGRTIVIQEKSEGNTEIFAVDVESGDRRNLTQNPARDSSPFWSPDGSKIIFASSREGASDASSIFKMNPDGSGVERVFSRNGYELSPTIAPDSRTIAFAGDRTDGSSRALDIFIADLNDPSSERVVTKLRFHDTQPVFSPDGKRIAFTSQSDGNEEIYIVNTDGSGLVRITRHPAADRIPMFSKDGKSLYFVSDRAGRSAVYEMRVVD